MHGGGGGGEGAAAGPVTGAGLMDWRVTAGAQGGGGAQQSIPSPQAQAHACAYTHLAKRPSQGGTHGCRRLPGRPAAPHTSRHARTCRHGCGAERCGASSAGWCPASSSAASCSPCRPGTAAGGGASASRASPKRIASWPEVAVASSPAADGSCAHTRPRAQTADAPSATCHVPHISTGASAAGGVAVSNDNDGPTSPRSLKLGLYTHKHTHMPAGRQAGTGGMWVLHSTHTSQVVPHPAPAQWVQPAVLRGVSQPHPTPAPRTPRGRPQQPVPSRHPTPPVRPLTAATGSAARLAIQCLSAPQSGTSSTAGAGAGAASSAWQAACAALRTSLEWCTMVTASSRHTASREPGGQEGGAGHRVRGWGLGQGAEEREAGGKAPQRQRHAKAPQ